MRVEAGTDRPRRRIHPGAIGLLLAGAAVVIALVVVELLVRLTGIDQRLVAKAVSFQAADLPVHRRSADAFLHYELKPGAQYSGARPDKTPYTVTIDEFGARFPSHAATKAAGTFRILAFGGSTLYGAGVNDDQTLAAALERRLNAEPTPPGAPVLRFEVWNFGTSAYTLGQAAHLARLELPRRSADLILIQDHNRGRRGFLMPEDNRPESYPTALLLSDPQFYREQFYTPRFPPLAFHLNAMEYSAAYRAATIAILLLADLRQYDYCNSLSADEARALSREAAAVSVPVVYFAIPADRGFFGASSVFPELQAEQYIDLYRPDADPLFYEPHPPASFLDQFAALLIEELRARHLLPNAPDSPFPSREGG